MTILEAIDQRHSVRSFKDTPIDVQTRAQLDEFVAECNSKSGLEIFIVYDDPAGFDSAMAHYGKFHGCSNYIVLAGPRSGDFEYLCGYYGEQIVLRAQQLGLNTCWTAMTFNKKQVKKLIPQGQSLCMVIALGYGKDQGVPHRSKTPEDVILGAVPLWFDSGIEAALKAPTAMNQQKFAFYEKDGEPYIKVKGLSMYTMVDLGIAAYHFEAAIGRKVNRE